MFIGGGDNFKPCYELTNTNNGSSRSRKRGAQIMDKARYRIQKANGYIKYVGTDEPSWFTLEKARLLVNYNDGERIVEHDGVNILWEIL